MNLDLYLEKKTAGLVTLVKAGNAGALIAKKFNPDTGAEIQPEIISIDVEVLIKQKEQLMKNIEAIDLIIADLNDLK